MALYKLNDYYPNYRETFGDDKLSNVNNYSVYTEGENRVGSAKDLLVDESGRFRYVVVDTGPWIFGKDVLLPIGLARFDYSKDRIFVDGLSKGQVEDLPSYQSDKVVDEKYENQVRQQYRPQGERRSRRRFIDRSTSETQGNGHRKTVYDNEPTLYGMSEEDNQGPLKLYEERLVTNRNRVKAGEVAVGKRVETKTAEAAVPVEKERVVVERHDATGKTVQGRPSGQFKDQEVARVDVYEDEANIEKETFAREEVSVHKETERDMARAKETVRREELDVDTKGDVNIDRR